MEAAPAMLSLYAGGEKLASSSWEGRGNCFKVSQGWKELGKQKFILQYSGKFEKHKIECNYLFVATDQPGGSEKALEG